MNNKSKKSCEFYFNVGLISLLTVFHSLDSLAEGGNRSIASENNALEIAAPGRVPLSILEKNGWKVNLSGFTELDAFSDSSRSLTEVPGNSPIDRGNTYNGANGRTQFSLRNSRFAFSIMPPEVEGLKTKGYLEFDLLGFEPSPGIGSLIDATTGKSASDTALNKITNPASLSEANFFTAPTLRLRHAYLSSELSGWQFLAGQYWSLFGWKPFYFLTPLEVSPTAGMLFERAPQVTVIKTVGEENKLQVGVSVVRPVQRDAVTPRLDVGLRYSIGSWKAGNTSGPTGEIRTQPLSIGLSGTLRDFSTPAGDGTLSDTTHALGSAFAVDLNIPILPSSDGKDVGNTLTLQGEFTSGSGYADQFPGWSGGVSQTLTPTFTGGLDSPNLDAGQGVSTSAGLQLISLLSYNLQLQYHLPTNWKSFINIGYGQLYSNNIFQYGGTINRQEMAFANLFHDFTTQIRVGAEYALQQTYYLPTSITATFADQAVNRRIQFSCYFIF